MTVRWLQMRLDIHSISGMSASTNVRRVKLGWAPLTTQVSTCIATMCCGHCNPCLRSARTRKNKQDATRSHKFSANRQPCPKDTPTTNGMLSKSIVPLQRSARQAQPRFSLAHTRCKLWVSWFRRIRTVAVMAAATPAASADGAAEELSEAVMIVDNM